MIVEYKGIPVDIAVYGKGKPVVFLHGFLENKKIWKRFIPEFQKDYQLICPDLFGHGETPIHNAIHSMEEMADAVALILSKMEIDSATLIGHSMGGYVTLAFAEKFPERLKSLLLLDSSSQADSKRRLKERDQSIRVVRKHKKAFVRSAIGSLFTEKNRLQYKAILKAHIAEGLQIETESIVASLKGMKHRKNRTVILKKFSGPKWIVAGEDDPIISSEGLAQLAADTGAKLVLVPGGHLSYIEAQQQVGHHLAKFLSL